MGTDMPQSTKRKTAADLFGEPDTPVPTDPEILRQEVIRLRREVRLLQNRLERAEARSSGYSRDADFAREQSRALYEQTRRGDEFS